MFRKSKNPVEIIQAKFKIKQYVGENEQLCTHCEGRGVILEEIPLALTPNNTLHKEILSPCPYCEEGIQRICTQCHNPYPKYQTNCRCHTVGHMADSSEIKAIQLDKLDITVRSLTEIQSSVPLLYIQSHDEFVYTKELISWVALMLEADEQFDLRDCRIFATRTQKPDLDVDVLLETLSQQTNSTQLHMIPDSVREDLAEHLQSWYKEHQFILDATVIDFAQQVAISDEEWQNILSQIDEWSASIG